jgi:hypothetical protein
MRLDRRFIQLLLNQTESLAVIPMCDGFPSLDDRWFCGQFPCTSPNINDFLYIAERLILAKRRQPLSSIPNLR